MHNSIYRSLINNPPKLEIKQNAREVIFTTISSMCDNKGRLTLKKNAEGDFKMSGNGFALSNWQFKHSIDEIEWSADDQHWEEVIKMINTGTSKISEVRSR